MTWEEHEREYCHEIDFRPDNDDIHEICSSWSRACQSKEFYDCRSEEGNSSSIVAVRFQESYFVVHANSKEQIEKYKKPVNNIPNGILKPLSRVWGRAGMNSFF